MTPEALTASRQGCLMGTVTHRQHFAALVEALGRETLTAMLPSPITPREWRGFFEQDEHLNNVALQRWDRRHRKVQALAFARGFSWSLSDTVCTLKELAKQIGEGASE